MFEYQSLSVKPMKTIFNLSQIQQTNIQNAENQSNAKNWCINWTKNTGNSHNIRSGYHSISAKTNENNT